MFVRQLKLIITKVLFYYQENFWKTGNISLHSNKEIHFVEYLDKDLTRTFL